MIIAVLADEKLKNEFLARDFAPGVEIIWADTVKVLNSLSDIDAYFDLEFRLDDERTAELRKLLPKPVFLNSVPWTLRQIGEPFFRIVGWPTLLNKKIAEVAIGEKNMRKIVHSIFNRMSWDVEIVADVPGLIAPRIVAMIINEAYYTFGDKVSTKEEIDVAMKLGTNYPYGPFEWGEKIGLDRVHALLLELNKIDDSYTIAPELVKEVRG